MAIYSTSSYQNEEKPQYYIVKVAQVQKTDEYTLTCLLFMRVLDPFELHLDKASIRCSHTVKGSAPRW